jgi:hypothetical protein
MTDKSRDDRELPVERSEETAETSKLTADAPTELPDPNDEVPVPIVMSPAEVDERAQVVEELRKEEGIPTPPEQQVDQQP